MRLFTQHHYVFPLSKTMNCFLFTSLIATTKTDLKQSSILQLILVNSVENCRTTERFTGQIGLWSTWFLRKPSHELALWVRMVHASFHISFMIRSSIGFSFSECTLLFCMLCYVEMFLKEKISCNYKTK